MESNVPNMDIELVRRALKARIAKAACMHLDKVEPRAAVALQMAGVFKTDFGMGSINDDARRLLLDRSDSQRIESCRGPFIFYKVAEENGQQFAMDVTLILLADDAKLRIAALDHFDGLRASKPGCLSARTSRLLDDRRELITSSREWRLGAVELFDAIQDDFLVHLSAVEQSLEQQFDEGIRDHLPKVLRPSLTSVEGLELSIANPSVQKDEIDCFVNECSSLPTLAAACSNYMAVLGYAPIQANHSLGAVISKWVEAHPSEVEPWETLWNWAKEEGSPIARYHLCAAFLDHSEWVPEGMESFVWREVTEIVAPTLPLTSALQLQAEWVLLRQLAQHYLRFLGSWAPGALGDTLAISAWWLSSRVCQLLQRRSATKGPFVDTAISPELYGSSHAWRLSLPRNTGSLFTIATHLGGVPWALSILQRIRLDSLERLGAADDEQLKSIFEKGLASTIMVGVPIVDESITAPTYQFELSLGEAIKAWRDFQPEGRDTEVAASILMTYEKLIDATKFVSALRSISQEDELNQLIIANWARSLASQGRMPIDEVWPLLEDREWMESMVRKTREAALDSLFLAFSIAFQNDRSRCVKLPHIYALTCDRLSDDPKRMRLMFWYVAISCLHSYSVSALQRLLHGEHRTRYLELSPELKNWLTEGQTTPPWLAARIRGVLDAL